MEGRIYVVFPGSRPSTVSIIHKRQPAVEDKVEFDPKGVNVDWNLFGVAAGEGGASTLIIPHLVSVPLPQAVAISILTVAGDALPSESRVAIIKRDDWSVYQAFRFPGSPGGPTAQNFVPNGITRNGYVLFGNGHIALPNSMDAWISIASTPPDFPVEKIRPRGPTVVVVAATDRFFAFALTPEGYKSLGLTPSGLESVYVHDRKLNTWKEITSASTVPVGRRIFGSWLATIVEVYIKGEGNPENPGRENERSYQLTRENQGDLELQRLPNTRELYAEAAAKGISIPGLLLMDNLEDGRRITLNTRQEDSEILDVRSDGLVLYRVNDSIFAAQIEGSKLSKPTVVVKDEDVPEVHWVFWSHFEPLPAKSLPLGRVAAGQTGPSSLDAELIQAANLGDGAAVRQLLQKGANIEARDEYGATALTLAAHYSNAEVVKLLLDKGANVEAHDKYGSAALPLAAEQGKTDVVNLLLEKGANIEARDQYDSTPLLRAVFGGHPETVKVLIDRHANVEAQDKGGRTALLLAVQGKNREIVNLLLESGAKINAGGEKSPLLWAVRQNNTDIVKVLLDKGANPEVVDQDGAMPLTMAVGQGNVEIVKLLIDKGVHPADYGSSVLFRGRNSMEMLKLLLDKGANVNARDTNGATMLIESVRGDKIEVMRLLLDHGADINAKDNEGMTALMKAAFWGKLDIARLLLEKGTDLNAVDNQGHTALSFATSGAVHNPELLNLLKEKGAQPGKPFQPLIPLVPHRSSGGA
jgi:cytohesin